MPVREAGQMIDDFEVRLEAGLGRLLGVGFEIVDAADAVEQVESKARVVRRKRQTSSRSAGVDDHERIDGVELLGS